MKPLYKGLLVALLHLLIVSSLGGKLLYDRATRPRVWVKTRPYDPNLPIRGRYVRLQLEVEARGFADSDWKDRGRSRWNALPVTLSVEDNKLIATISKTSTGNYLRLNTLNRVQQDADPLQRAGLTSVTTSNHQIDEHLKISGGIYVKEIRPGSPAARAGLQTGDIILRVDGNPVKNENEFHASLRREDASQQIRLGVIQGHRNLTLTLTLPAEKAEPSDPENRMAMLSSSVLFFIPEHVKDPSRRATGEELWVEVTLPKKGPPRPIRLGVKKEGGEITPLELD